MLSEIVHTTIVANGSLPVSNAHACWFRRTVRLLLLFGVGYFVLVNADVVGMAVARMGSIAITPALIGVGLSLVAMVNRGLLNRWTHRGVGIKVRPALITRTTAVGFSANKVIKSGGVSGLAVFIRHGKTRGHDAGSVIAACILSSLASFAASGTLLAVALVILATTGRLTGWWIVAGTWFVTYLALIGCIGIVASRHQVVASRVWQKASHLLRRALRREPMPIDAMVTDEIYTAMRTAQTTSGWKYRALGHAIASKGLGCGTLLSAAAATGISLSLATGIVIYAAALSVSSISITPGGIGTVEASTGALLVGAGASVPIAALAVALFRIFDLWMPVALGAVVGRNELRNPKSTSSGTETRPVPTAERDLLAA